MKSLRHLPFALLLALVSCSTEAAPVKTGGGAADSHGGAPKTEAPAPSGDTAEFAVEGNDLMQFSVKEIAVQAGQKVTITLKNVGKMPKTAMGHNLVVLKKGVTAADFGMRVATSGKGKLENDHLPEDMRGETLAHCKILGPGEDAVIEFTAPAIPCTLEYVCTFPGHFATMNGKIVVK